MRLTAAVGAVVVCGGLLRAQPCAPGWAEGFYHAPLRNGPTAATTWVGPGGPVLMIGGTPSGSFFGHAPLGRPAVWNGHAFVNAPMTVNGTVMCFAQFDPDGAGPRGESLVMGGFFTQQTGGEPNEFTGLAMWNGTELEWIGNLSGSGAHVRAMAIHDDGSGAKLYVAGQFTHVVGLPAANIACWDGDTWSTLGSGISFGAQGSVISSLASHGGALYVGGAFGTAGGVAVNGIARWQGGSWAALGSGLTPPTGSQVSVNTVTSVDTPATGGPALVVTGNFTAAGGNAAYRIAKWQGDAWQAMGATGPTTPASSPHGVGVLDGPGGRQLYAHMLGALGRWDGAVWQPVAAMPGAQVLTLDTSGPRPRLVIATTQVGDLPVGGLAAYDGESWSVFGGMGHGFDGPVYDLVAGDIGSGERLFATGQFNRTAAALTFRVAEWDGVRWSPMGGPPALGSQYFSLEVYDDGGGNDLYLSGSLGQRVYRWTGADWAQVGQQIGDFGAVQRLKVLDIGDGPHLYAMGQMGTLQNIWAITRLEAGQWVHVGPCCLNRVVDAEVFDPDGPGPLPHMLHIAGSFNLSTDTVRRLESGAWVNASPPSSNQISALKVFDDGNGPALWAQGAFDGNGPGVARLRSGQWTQVGTLRGLTSESAEMHVFDDGNGPTLYIGSFFMGPNNESYGLVKLEDGEWTPLAASGGGAGRKSFASYTHLGRPALFFAGNVNYTPGPLQPRMDYIGAIVGCPRTCTADFDLDGDSGTDADIQAFFACLAGNCCQGCLTTDFNGDGDVGTDGDIESFFRVLAGGNC